MARKTQPAFADLLAAAAGKLRPPLATVLGGPGEVAALMSKLPAGEIDCYQMDLYQAERLREQLVERACRAEVQTAADLWDLPRPYRTLIYPIAKGGERSLKIDMIEQAYHTLEPLGNLLVLSPYEKDDFLPRALKKVFKRVHAPGAGLGMLFTCCRTDCQSVPRPKRRHEVTFQVQSEFGRSLRFLSRPGVFAYGRFDDGARALVETMEIDRGDRILDLGCGCGTNGVFAGLRGGPDSFVQFVDSNVRAAALAEINAAAQGLSNFRVLASSSVAGLSDEEFDVILANPPYFAQQSIAAMFIEESWRLLRPGGRLYLVTKQPDTVASFIIESFGDAESAERRGYHILCGRKPQTHPGRKSLGVIT